MDDREIVAALAAGDPDGVGGAYDAYAKSIYGYCRWMLADTGDAAEAVRDTFVLAARELGHRLRDPSKMRLWLFRTARSECLRRPRAGAAGAGADVDGADVDGAGVDGAGVDGAGVDGAGVDGAGVDGAGVDGGSPSQEAADLRRLIRATLAALTADEREAVELNLWHDLDDTDVAAMLGVSPERAYALVGNGRRQLEKTLGALRIARTRRGACPELDELLAGHDEQLTAGVLKLVGEHVAQCDGCGAGKPGTLRPEALTRLLPLPAPPADLREQVLDRAAVGTVGAGTIGAGTIGAGTIGAATRSSPAPRAGAGLAVVLAGWGQRAMRVKAVGWNLMRRSPRATVAAVAMLVVVAASITLITANDAHAARNPAARSDGSTAGASGPAGTSGAGTIADPEANNPPSPKRSGQAIPSAASFLVPSTTSPRRVTPSKSPRPGPPGFVTLPSASASASASSSPPPPSSSPTPTRTRSASPSPTPTDSPTPTESPTPTDSPTPSSSATPTDTSTSTST
jgi:RNA polymerase sigma factor (sigma-70 family)